MFDKRKKELSLKIMLGDDGSIESVEDQTADVQDKLKEEDSAPLLEEVDGKKEEKEELDPEMAREMMGGAEDDTQKSMEAGEKPRSLNGAVRMNILKKKLIKE